MPTDIWQVSGEYERSMFAAQQRRLHEVEAIKRRITPEVAQEVAGLSGAHGGVLSPGMLQALAQMRAATPTDQLLAHDSDPNVQMALQMEAEAGLEETRGAMGWAKAAARGTVRTALAGFDALFDTVVLNPIRIGIDASNEDVSFGEAVDRTFSAKSAGARGFDQLISGERVELGEGWLPGGENYAMERADRGDAIDADFDMFIDPSRPEYDPEKFAEMQDRKANAQLDPHGQPISLGRYAAGSLYDQFNVIEPGTKPYNLLSGLIDASVMFAADPASKGMQIAGRSRQATRTFSSVDNPWGLVTNTHRTTVDPEKVRDFLDSGGGQKLKGYLAENVDHEDVYNLLSSKGQHSTISRSLVNEIVEAGDEISVDRILSRELGASIRERPSLARHQAFSSQLPGVQKSLRDMRFMQDLPGKSVSLQTLDQDINSFKNYLINGQVDTAARKELMGSYMQVETMDDLETVFVRAAREIDRSIHATTGRKGIRLADKYYDGFEKIKNNLRQQYAEDVEIGRMPSMTLGGEWQDLNPMVKTLAEYESSVVPLLDVKQVKHATSQMYNILDKTGPLGNSVEGLIGAAEFYMGVWKPLQLLRPAWLTRVLGEQQVRFASLGVRNQFSNPFEAISVALGMKDETLRAALSGDTFDVLAAHRSALTNGSGGWLDTPGIKFKDRDLVSFGKDSPEYANVWLDEMADLVDDNTARTVARSMIDPEFTVTKAAHAASEVDDFAFARQLIDEQPDTGAPFDKWELEDLAASDPSAVISQLATPGRPNLERLHKELEQATGYGPVDGVRGDIQSYLNGWDDYDAVQRASIIEDINDLLDDSKEGLKRLGVDVDDILTSPAARPVRAATEPEVLHGPEAVKYWFWEGEGAKHRQALNRQRAEAAAQEANSRGEMIDTTLTMLDSEEKAGRYIDNIYARINEETRNSSELLNFIASGSLPANRKLAGGRTTKQVGYTPMSKNRELVRELDKMKEFGPDMVMGPDLYRNEAAWTTKLKSAVDTLFEVSMTKVDNRYFRSPLYAQRYFERVAELAPKMSKATYDEAVTRAVKANMPDDILDRLRRATPGKFADQVDATGAKVPNAQITLEEMEVISQAYALDEVRKTLYDLSKRSQMAEQLRLIAPFAEAWREVLGFWSKEAARNPAFLRRGAAAYEAAGEGGGELTGNPGQGFFYANEFGDEVFAYPGGGIIGNLLGLEEGVDLEANAAGLNLVAGSVLPGMGPVVQWGVAAADRNGVADQVLDALAPTFITGSDQSGSDFFRNMVSPFGENELTFENAVAAGLPAWAKTLLNANGGIDQAQYNNTVAEIMKANVVSGRVPRDQVEDNFKMASEQASQLFIVRGLANSTLPTGFRPKVKVEDINGREFQITALTNTYRNLLATMNGDTEQATAAFVAEFGLDPLLLNQAKTRQKVPRNTQDKGGFDWEQDNLDLRHDYSAIFGLISPLTGEPADYSEYIQALRAGDIVQLDAKQQMMLANAAAGNAAWYTFKEQLDLAAEANGLTQAQTRPIADSYRAGLRLKYEGFDTHIPGVIENASTDDKIAQARMAMFDPRLEDLPVTPLIQQWFAVRDQSEAMVQEAYGVGLSAQKTAAPVRQALAMYGEHLAQQNPQFAGIWTQALKREVD